MSFNRRSHKVIPRKYSRLVALQAEAELAACLFVELRSFLIDQTRRGVKVQTTRVGVITFYKQQVDVLRRAFEHIAGPEIASEVKP
jgi:hypothetical protein